VCAASRLAPPLPSRLATGSPTQPASPPLPTLPPPLGHVCTATPLPRRHVAPPHKHVPTPPTPTTPSHLVLPSRMLAYADVWWRMVWQTSAPSGPPAAASIREGVRLCRMCLCYMSVVSCKCSVHNTFVHVYMYILVNL
jgi:hypothetical protein